EPLLSPALLFRALRVRASGETPGGPHLFSYARFALATFLQERALGDAVLYVPSYICEDAVAPLRPLGQSVRYYPVAEGLEPDWDWLDGHVEDGDGALLLVHYFGFPNAIDRALEFCRSHGLALVEDCAHSFLTRHRGIPIGTFGDGGFYSFRKLLPIPDGAGLVTNGISIDNPVQDNWPSFQRTHWTYIARQLLKSGIYQSRTATAFLNRFRAQAQTSVRSTSVPRHMDDADTKISRISYQTMKVLEPEYSTMSALRRKNYLYLLEAFSEYPEAIPLYPVLEEEVCPYAFPVLLADRPEVMQRLQASGVPAHPWPDLSPEVEGNPQFPMANRYANQVMLLPVHQDLNAIHLQQVVDIYRKVRQA
ncbi:MAG: DegT/DnrJ/EryC1/StrS family aminotransferase, partial [Dehalococcoidia bacterium]|nr:DegT/DnrJ/EryC1/StrS family aminotransferase [Dehalococcoidia bacterium]